jgi:hypothetical protein
MLSLSRFKVNLYNTFLGEGSDSAIPTPTLILDFVPTSGLDGETLNMSFVAQDYYAYSGDPTVQSGITNIQVWS